MKLNIDGSCKEVVFVGFVGCGGVVRGSNGEWLGVARCVLLRMWGVVVPM